TTEAPTTKISPTRARPLVASTTRSRAFFNKLILRVHQDPRIVPARSLTRTAGRKNHGRLPRCASDHGRGRSRDRDPDQFDSTGPCTRAIRLTSWAASAARLQSEYLASG